MCNSSKRHMYHQVVIKFLLSSKVAAVSFQLVILANERRVEETNCHIYEEIAYYEPNDNLNSM